MDSFNPLRVLPPPAETVLLDLENGGAAGSPDRPQFCRFDQGSPHWRIAWITPAAEASSATAAIQEAARVASSQLKITADPTRAASAASSDAHIVLELLEGSGAARASALLAEAALAADPEFEDETYVLEIRDGRVAVTAPRPVGLFYGIQTLRQLLDTARTDSAGGGASIEASASTIVELPAVVVRDGPRFPWRGLLLDCVRHFQPIPLILDLLDWLAYHKLNVLHWHVTDDQGWRLPIASRPRLAEVGGADGVYTAADVAAVVRRAAELHVRVVPEVELPGHCVAALAAYAELGCSRGPYVVPREQWGIFDDVFCAGRENTFEFLGDAMHGVARAVGVVDGGRDGKGGGFLHLGGDEVPRTRWDACEDCRARVVSEGLSGIGAGDQLQAYFFRRAAGLALSPAVGGARRLVAWDEVLDDGGLAGGPLPAGVAPGVLAVQCWRGMAAAREAVRRGHGAITSPTAHCYLDYPLSRLDLRAAYAFEPVPEGEEDAKTGATISGRGLVLGSEACMWSERAPPESIPGKVFPRLVAIATKVWAPKAVNEAISFEEFLEL
ncbi:Beta-hexosaminidase, partial [Cladochytrium tenue]